MTIMGTYLRIFAMVFCLSLIALTNAFGQAGIDDSQMRESAAARIMNAHSIKIDWRNTSLLDITDIEARLNAVARINRDHEITFDWRKTSLLELTDAEARLNAVGRIKSNHGVAFDWEKTSLILLINAEARMNTAKRIGLGTGKSIDWKEHSMEDLLRMEAGLSQANTNQGTITLPFDVLFPPAKQQAMGLHKLTQAEKQELHKHIEALLIAAAQAGAQQITPPPLIQPSSRAATSHSSVIESKMDGDFEGWEGDTIVKLMNGQIWQQTEYYYHYHYAFMPDVSVYKSGGGWKMKVEGIDRAVGVQQLDSRQNAPLAGHSAAIPKIYAGVSGSHWVKKNIDSGTKILLEDGSLWEIDPFDKIDAMLWLPISNITVIESSSGSPGYDYLLINADDGEKAHAKYMGKQ